jgi:hypothetical protein
MSILTFISEKLEHIAQKICYNETVYYLERDANWPNLIVQKKAKKKSAMHCSTKHYTQKSNRKLLRHTKRHRSSWSLSTLKLKRTF